MPHTKSLEFRQLSRQDSAAIVPLANQLHTEIDSREFDTNLSAMFDLPTFHCFGLWLGEKLVAVSNGWITIRFSSGKQLEVDNVVVDPGLRSQGVGKYFFECIHAWAIQNGCNTVELNTYVMNSKSHKFYFNEGHAILGFHFQKLLKNSSPRTLYPTK